jgi:signal transduction histidine kinase
MRPSARSLGFPLAALVVVAALSALTWAAIRLEAAELQARQAARNTEQARRALWSIDSWMGAWLAAETARPVDDYFAVGDSPAFAPLILSRFEHGPEGWRHAGAPFPPDGLPPSAVRTGVRTAEEGLHRQITERDDPSLDERIATCVSPPDRPGGAGPDYGPILPFFVDATPPAVDRFLLMTRRVLAPGGERLQGVAVDWEALKTRLLATLDDDSSRYALRPSGAGMRLATLPARLEFRPPPPTAEPWWTPLRGAIALAWVLVLFALVALGMALRRSFELAERRERFALAVTHELRTPLTTLRMYAEMLAGGMVADPAVREEYLGTLRDEADRLGNLVENVLAFARVERTPSPADRELISLRDLMEGVLPSLRLQAERSGLSLTVAPVADVRRRVRADIETVGQVLRNLVDNAAKYATGGERGLRLEVSDGPRFVGLRLGDSGPGVPEADRDRIFTPYERGRRTDPAVPGIGLGLGLSRALARELGGDLVLEPTDPNTGAVFRLDIPVEDGGA